MKSLRFLLSNYPTGDQVAAEVRITDGLMERLIEAYKYASETGNSVLVATMANVIYLDDEDVEDMEDVEECDEPKINAYMVEFEVTVHRWMLWYVDENANVYQSNRFPAYKVVEEFGI